MFTEHTNIFSDNRKKQIVFKKTLAQWSAHIISESIL